MRGALVSAQRRHSASDELTASLQRLAFVAAHAAMAEELARRWARPEPGVPEFGCAVRSAVQRGGGVGARRAASGVHRRRRPETAPK
jgi:hypothetical protein